MFTHTICACLSHDLVEMTWDQSNDERHRLIGCRKMTVDVYVGDQRHPAKFTVRATNRVLLFLISLIRCFSVIYDDDSIHVN